MNLVLARLSSRNPECDHVRAPLRYPEQISPWQITARPTPNLGAMKSVDVTPHSAEIDPPPQYTAPDAKPPPLVICWEVARATRLDLGPYPLARWKLSLAPNSIRPSDATEALLLWKEAREGWISFVN